MELSDDSGAVARNSPGLSLLERSLRRALATSESPEARYHIRTALQSLAVVREGDASADRPADPSSDRQ
ncbi:hypothetical protein [Halobaculum marinum]|uniref:Uncharacterized protein n=1 Tax=Halobaculum marinum TaxID=3031996 RepID=A0ABD5X561_9EURY|nr:hypothetical protein [Halobaculum sp. DT55]